ncbi:hypothetical protein MSG28_005732 [Choristoneura fumiferana]|uniref:Uncharacterized protein n=1 Tax=Choristoneura fumiferana TaxID=7141 RepID=A0ACC0L0I0_CHOFU|nr:hypothetical protein MSG28_005732 [Choristoneura fumiferana]
MDQLPLNPVLKFNPNQLYEVRKLFGLEDKDKLKQAIDQFEDWIKKQNHFDVTDFDRGFLERLIIFSKGSLERAKQRLDKMCTFRKLWNNSVYFRTLKKKR